MRPKVPQLDNDLAILAIEVISGSFLNCERNPLILSFSVCAWAMARGQDGEGCDGVGGVDPALPGSGCYVPGPCICALSIYVSLELEFYYMLRK